MEEIKKNEKVDIMKAVKSNHEIEKSERAEKRAERKKQREEKKADKKSIGTTIKLVASYAAVAAAAASTAVGVMKAVNSHGATIPIIQEIPEILTDTNVGVEAAVPVMGETA